MCMIMDECTYMYLGGGGDGGRMVWRDIVTQSGSQLLYRLINNASRGVRPVLDYLYRNIINRVPRTELITSGIHIPWYWPWIILFWVECHAGERLTWPTFRISKTLQYFTHTSYIFNFTELIDTVSVNTVQCSVSLAWLQRF